MKETIKRAFLGGIVFLGTILFGFMGYSAWTSLTADIPNQNSGDLMTSSIWNNLADKLNKTIDNVNLLNTSISSINSVPAGAVMAFNLDTCPTGWTALASANGKVIVGVGSDGQGNTYTRGITGGEAKHTLSVAEMPSHTHQEHYTGGSPTRSLSRIGVHSTTNSAGNIPGIFTEPTGGGQSHENRQPYLVLLYCVKN